VIAAIRLPEQPERCLLHRTDPDGQIIHLALRLFWFFGRPQPDATQADINSDRVQSAEVVTRHADQLRATLAIAYLDTVGPCLATESNGCCAFA